MSLVLSLNTLHRERRMSVQVTESSVVKSASRWVRCRYPIAGESSWQETLLHRSRRKIQVQKGAHDVVRPSETLSPLTYMGLLSKSAILEMGEAGYRIVSCSHTQHSEFVTTEALIDSPFLLCGRGQSDGQRRNQNDSSRSRVMSI